MPIYEYQCEKCHSVFEEWQSGYEEREMDCPDCGGTSKRLISNTSFHLKGGGWFADGYSGKESGSQSGEATASAGADSSGAGEAPKKTESTDTSSAGSAS